MAPTLEHVFTMHLERGKTALSLGSTLGSAPRSIAPLAGGYLRTLPSSSAAESSSPVNASLIGGCSDWLRVDTSTGTGHLDARVQFRDEQADANYYVRFEGIVRLDDLIAKVVSWDREARTTESREHYHFSSPIFEVSREEDKWMERTAWVAHGHYCVEKGESGEVEAQAVEFEVYKLVTG